MPVHLASVTLQISGNFGRGEIGWPLLDIVLSLITVARSAIYGIHIQTDAIPMELLVEVSWRENGRQMGYENCPASFGHRSDDTT